MTGLPQLDIAVFAISVLCAMVMAAAEVALDSVSRSRLEELEEKGDARAALALKLKQGQEDLRGAVQIVTVFCVIIAAAIAEHHTYLWIQASPWAANSWWIITAAHGISVMIAALLITSIFLISTLFAKSLGTHYADRFSLGSAGMMRMLTRMLHLPQKGLTLFANILLRPAGRTATFSDSAISEENLMDILEEGMETGLLDKTEHELIEGIFRFTDRTASEVMIPRTDVVAIDSALSPEEIVAQVMRDGFTRMPVYSGSMDNIIGVIYAKDVFSLIEHKNLIILHDILRPPFVVPGTKSVPDLLREFQRKRIHLAVVVDEFGGTEGIITLEDILEEIVGDIKDEYDEDARPFERLADGVIEVEGRMNITDFNELAEYHIPESEEYDTLGGFITKIMGRIPSAGDQCTFEDILIDIVKVEERRIELVRIVRKEIREATH
jgi:putative hemolysin